MRMRFLAAGTALAISSAIAVGQTATRDDGSADRRSSARVERAQARADAQALALLDADNEAAFRLGSLAIEKTSNEKVRDYARQLINDHRRFDAEVHAAVTARPSASPPARSTRSSTRATRSGEVVYQPVEDEPPVMGQRSGGRMRAEEPPVARISPAPEERPQQPRSRAGEASPVYGTRHGSPLSGQETGPTGTRARDVLQGETGGFLARGLRHRPNTGVTLGPEPVVNPPADPTRPPVLAPVDRTDYGIKIAPRDQETRSRSIRARDQRLDAFGRAGDVPGPARPAPAPADLTTARGHFDTEAAERMQAETPPLGIMHDVLDRRIVLAEQELQELEDAEFDRAFLNHQVFLHLDTLSTLESVAARTSPELRQVIGAAAETEREHLVEARSLLAELRGRNSGETEDSPSSTEESARPDSEGKSEQQPDAASQENETSGGKSQQDATQTEDDSGNESGKSEKDRTSDDESDDE